MELFFLSIFLKQSVHMKGDSYEADQTSHG